MLVGTNNRGIHKQLLQIGVSLERFSNPTPYAAHFPTGESDIYGVPVPKLTGQIPPWAPCAGYEQHCFNKAAVIGSSPAFVCRFARKQMRNPQPLFVVQHQSIHDLHPNSRM